MSKLPCWKLGLAACALFVATTTRAGAEGPLPSVANPMSVWLGVMDQLAKGLGDTRDANQQANIFAQLRKAMPCGASTDNDAEGQSCPFSDNGSPDQH